MELNWQIYGPRSATYSDAQLMLFMVSSIWRIWSIPPELSNNTHFHRTHNYVCMGPMFMCGVKGL